MAKRIKAKKVEKLIRRFDAGTLTEKERMLVRRIMEECARMVCNAKDDD